MILTAQRGPAYVLLVCLFGAAGLVCGALLASWRPPGTDPATFECRPWLDHLWKCEAKFLSKTGMPGLWPKWESYRESSTRGDCDRGMVAFLDLQPAGEFLILMKPESHPATWVRKTYTVH